MRITRLLLTRYGHLSDVSLEFDAGVGLHIVLGGNEAGKSTALAAISDALFGFPHRTPFAFLHEQQELRVGIEVEMADGRRGSFVRRKGRRDTLRDAADAPVPESAMAAFLAGASRERFTELFGMDGAELRRGGLAILKGEGEIGQSIVQAYTGLHNVRGAVDRLNDEALRLYGDRRGKRAFHIAADSIQAARREMDAHSVRRADYEKARTERADAIQARQANTTAEAELAAERAQLDRIRRTTPARLALQRHQSARVALGVVASLPPDAEDQRRKAVQTRESLLRELERESNAQSLDEAALQGLPIDEALLAEAAAIDALAADLQRIESAVRDRESQERQAGEALGRVEDCGKRLGLPLDAEALLQRMPSDPARSEASGAISEHTRLSGQRDGLADELAQASEAVLACRDNLAALGEAEPADALIAAVQAATAEGPVDEELDAAHAAYRESQFAADRAIAALPLWSGTAEALSLMQLPLASLTTQAEGELAAATAEAAACERTLRDHEQALQRLAAELAGVLAGGVPPSRETITVARERRDRAWRLIRRHRIEGGPPPTADERDGLPGDLAHGLGILIAEADALADHHAGEAERLASLQQVQANTARTTALRDGGRAALAEAKTRLEAAKAAWARLWQPSGITAQDPAVMREWRALRDAALTRIEDARAKQAALAPIQARHIRVRDPLTSVVPSSVPAAEGRVAPLLRAARQRLTEWEEGGRRRSEARTALAERKRALAALGRRQEALEEKLSVWQERWATIATAVGLTADASATAGADALEIWTKIDLHAHGWRAARERIGAMTADIEAFDRSSAECATRCAAGLVAAPAPERVRTLATRLAASRTAAAKREELRQRLATRAETLTTLENRLARAEDELAALRKLAGAQDDEALSAAIERAKEAAVLAAQIADREAELRRLDDGLTLDALAREAEGTDLEQLPARIKEIEARLSTIGEENEALAVSLRDVGSRLAAMERGQDAAGALQRMHDAAAEAEAIAARYVRVQLSHALLRAGVERFRREQQTPLLRAAGALFGALTAGRYERLAADEMEDGRIAVLALQPDGSSCPADRLSEGTRDQLYLALRLAAIQTHASHVEPLPFIADDLLASFDDQRARTALRALASFGQVTQTILFTHHAHIAALAEPATSRLHHLPDLADARGGT